MSLKKIKKELGKKTIKKDVVERIASKLAEDCVENNYNYAREQIEDGVIKKINFEEFIDEHYKGILIFSYKVENEGEDINVRQRINASNLEFEGEKYDIQCLHGNSMCCERNDGKKICNFEVSYFIEMVKKIIEELNNVTIKDK